MVRNDINHDPDIFFVASFNQVLEVISSTKIGIDFINIGSSVTVVVTRHIGWDRRDPNSIESHTLDVIKVVDNSLEGSSAIVT